MNANKISVSGADTAHGRTSGGFEPLLTKQELCDLVRLTPRSIENLVNAGKIPVIKLTPRIVRFRWSDVEAALATYRHN